MKLLLITFALLGLGVAGIAIKIWAKKDGDSCGFCGKTPEQFENCATSEHQ